MKRAPTLTTGDVMRRIAQQESVEVLLTNWDTMQAEAICKVVRRLEFKPLRYKTSFCGAPEPNAATVLLAVQAFSY